MALRIRLHPEPIQQQRQTDKHHNQPTQVDVLRTAAMVEAEEVEKDHHPKADTDIHQPADNHPLAFFADLAPLAIQPYPLLFPHHFDHILCTIPWHLRNAPHRFRLVVSLPFLAPRVHPHENGDEGKHAHD
jgi:hypothetical protein